MGPGPASGWYWTEKQFFDFIFIPATVSSLRWIWVIDISGWDSASSLTTANPWFWEVISPFDVIQMAKRESISAYNTSPTYFFYETKAGYYFRSVESMAAEGTVQDYTTFPAGSKYCDGLEKTAQEYSKIIGFNIVIITTFY